MIAGGVKVLAVAVVTLAAPAVVVAVTGGSDYGAYGGYPPALGLSASAAFLIAGLVAQLFWEVCLGMGGGSLGALAGRRNPPQWRLYPYPALAPGQSLPRLIGPDGQPLPPPPGMYLAGDTFAPPLSQALHHAAHPGESAAMGYIPTSHAPVHPAAPPMGHIPPPSPPPAHSH